MMMATDDQADQYKIVSIPALAYNEEDYPKNDEEFRRNLLGGVYIPYQDPLGRLPGEAMWPERFPVDRLEQIRINIGDYEFASQYQQLPRLMKGNFFDYADFQVIPRPLGKVGQWSRYNDLAIGSKTTADSNASLAGGMDEEGRFYLRDMIKVQSWEGFKPRVKTAMLSAEEKGTVWGFEDVAFQVLAFEEFMRDKALARVTMVRVKPEGDKVTRALPLQARAKAGKVYLIDGPWVREFLDEMVKFPRGRHDDQVDAASGVLGMIADGAPRGADLVSVIEVKDELD
jgi:predicted phage terminase large subunit-like protein